MHESRHIYKTSSSEHSVYCLSHEWVMSHTWMSHVSQMHESRHTYKTSSSEHRVYCLSHEWVMSHTWMSHVTRMYESRHIHKTSSSEHRVYCLSHVRGVDLVVIRRVDILTFYIGQPESGCMGHDSFMCHLLWYGVSTYVYIYISMRCVYRYKTYFISMRHLYII